MVLQPAMRTFRILLSVVTFLCDANCGFTQTWTQTSARTNFWRSIAASSDGTKLVAVGGRDTKYIYVSTNSGATWILANTPSTNWQAVASSADGKKLVAVAGGSIGFDIGGIGPIYTSTNSGETWTQTSAPVTNWQAVASSADGTKLVAVAGQIPVYRGGIYTTTNSGETWTKDVATDAFWSGVACSADGNKMIAVSGDIFLNAPVFVSTNSGLSWTKSSIQTIGPTLALNAVAASADGNNLVAVTGGQGIYISTDGGVTWFQTTALGTLGMSWTSVASSADGSKLTAVAWNGPIYTSSDYGDTWTMNNAPSNSWSSVAASADGNKMVAVVSGGLSGGGIWTAQNTPAPQMNIVPINGNLALSWIIPSTNFVLQQNSDLTSTNWADVTDAPVLNLANLQDEVMLPLPASNCFYRLATP
jgi:hypothetical protein